VVRIANVQMARALRRVSVERGHDPRDYSLVAFGGGGPLHACELAERVGIRRVLVPPHPGLLSALGLLLSDVVKDYSRTVMQPTDDAVVGELDQLFAALEEQALADMTAEGFDPAHVSLRHSLDMRYRGQSYELSVPVSGVQAFGRSGPVLSRLNLSDPERLNATFHERHAAAYGRSSPGRPTEIVQARLRAVGAVSKPALPNRAEEPDRPSPAPVVTQRIGFEEWREVPVYRRVDWLPGHRLAGPALLLQEDTTTLVPPGWQGVVDGWDNLRLSLP
jgi:N-methylhydantoinase A